MQHLTTTVARVLFGFPMAVFGIFHFMHGANMAGYVPAWIPGKVFFVYLTGAALIAAAVAIITKKQGRLACLLLGALLLIFVLTIHLPALCNPEFMQMAMPQFLKDTALAGAAFAFAGIFEKEET
ncbi:MAG: DoxX family protein [Candidatus Margulisbacteria bacterium]|nr:DoxX family protein [Candidatus Margulisiibacteriota bacterium]